MSEIEISRADKIICVASWETRFLEGVKKDLAASQASECIVFYTSALLSKVSPRISEMTSENIKKIEEYCEHNNIKFIAIELNYMSPLSTRNIINESLKYIEKRNSILLDITTMTREIMWLILETLTQIDPNINYVYWKPENTAKWTSKNSSQPRLVIGRAGVSEYGKPTLIAVTTGFDRSRLDQMVCFFEPEKTILFIQDGEQFENHTINEELYENYRLGGSHAQEVQINSYSDDHGLEKITQTLIPYLETHNVVLSSFGPKLSALALHKFAKMHPDVALAYTPTLELNEDYSKGIDECICGFI